MCSGRRWDLGGLQEEVAHDLGMKNHKMALRGKAFQLQGAAGTGAGRPDSLGRTWGTAQPAAKEHGTSRETRTQVLTFYVSSDQLWIWATHFIFPDLGFLLRNGDNDITCYLGLLSGATQTLRPQL